MIRAQNVSRRFGSAAAVDDVSFTVEPGEIVALVGEKGAGKSTLLRMLAGHLAPDSGRRIVCGHDVAREPWWVQRKIGYLSEQNALFESMRVDEFLEFLARVRGLEKEGAERRAFVVERCGLAGFRRERLRRCPEAARRRIGLAAALLHDPSVLLLDEPTSGLEPDAVQAFASLVRELRPGHAILVASPLSADAAALATRLLVLHEGRLVLDERTKGLAARAGAEGTTVEALALAAVRRRAQPAPPGAEAIRA